MNSFSASFILFSCEESEFIISTPYHSHRWQSPFYQKPDALSGKSDNISFL